MEQMIGNSVLSFKDSFYTVYLKAHSVPQPFSPCQGDILQEKVMCLQNEMSRVEVLLKVIK